MTAPTTRAEQSLQRQALRSHLGIVETAKLTAWAELVRRAWPTATVWVFGSALLRKDYADVDIAILLPAEGEYRDYDKDAAIGGRLGSAWDVIAAGLSALAREMTGVPVEARLQWVNPGPPPEWLTRNSLALAAPVDLPAPYPQNNERSSE